MLDELGAEAREYLPFLEDLRARLYRGAIIFGVFFVSGFFLTSLFLTYLLSALHMDDVTIATTSPFQFADLAMNCGFFLACLVTLPYVMYTLYSFISPGLTIYERRKFFLSLPVSIVLFLVGFSYGVVLFYYGLQFLAAMNTSLGIANIWDIGMFISQILVTATLLGVLFEFPIILTFCMKIGIITKRALRAKRKLAIASVFIFVALLPPTDGISLLAMSVPLIGLYEATLLFNQ